jgi:hypothetical protein
LRLLPPFLIYQLSSYAVSGCPSRCQCPIFFFSFPFLFLFSSFALSRLNLLVYSVCLAAPGKRRSASCHLLSTKSCRSLACLPLLPLTPQTESRRQFCCSVSPAAIFHEARAARFTSHLQSNLSVQQEAQFVACFRLRQEPPRNTPLFFAPCGPRRSRVRHFNSPSPTSRVA